MLRNIELGLELIELAPKRNGPARGRARSLDKETVESGEAKTRAAAMTNVVWLDDNALAPKKVNLSPAQDEVTRLRVSELGQHPVTYVQAFNPNGHAALGRRQ
jgi:hypothetical protein